MQNHTSSEDSRISQSLEITNSVARKQQRSIDMDENLQQKKVRQSNPVKLRIEDELQTEFEPGGPSPDFQSISLRELSERSHGDSLSFVGDRDREKSCQKKLSVLDHSTLGSSSPKILHSPSTYCNDASKIEHIHGIGLAFNHSESASLSGSSVTQVQKVPATEINIDTSTSLNASLSGSLKAINTNANVEERNQHQHLATLLQPLPPVLNLHFQVNRISQAGAPCMMPPYYPECNTINRGPLLHFPTDNEFLSEKQIFIRKQIEFFEAGLSEVGKTTSGRKRPIVRDQVGIQCRHCAVIPVRYRERGAVYFPSKLIGVYQAAQNMVSTHMTKLCRHIDTESKETLISFMQARSYTGHGGKVYWADTAKAQGVLELGTGGGLRFETRAIRDSSLISNTFRSEDEK